jgi:dipeptidase E
LLTADRKKKMKYYLSSFKIGNDVQKFKELFLKNTKIGFIPNALDFTGVDKKKVKTHIESDFQELCMLGLQVEMLNLSSYFGKYSDLERKVGELGAVWVCGGNVFVLRQAMQLSGFDKLLKDLSLKDDFLYSGYSAGCCVLSPNLNTYKIVDDSTDTPYQEQDTVIWEGIGLINYAFLPHFDSDHPESSAIDKEIEFCKVNNIPYKALRDGEALIFEQR